MEIGYMEPGILATLPEGVLFYPCSGPDLLEPISRFAPVVKEFWFVDMEYHFDVKNIDDTATQQRLRESVYDIFSQSRLNCTLRILDIAFRLPVATHKVVATRRDGRWRDPVDVVCLCLHKSSGREITVHLRRGCGLRCLEMHEFEYVSVFFYRGDGLGEGGSGNRWLEFSGMWFTQLVIRMSNNSLLVTDGSNSGHRMGRHLCPDGWENRGSHDLLEGVETEFEIQGHRYRLVGRVSDRYGPTCVWQYTNVAMLIP